MKKCRIFLTISFALMASACGPKLDTSADLNSLDTHSSWCLSPENNHCPLTYPRSLDVARGVDRIYLTKEILHSTKATALSPTRCNITSKFGDPPLAQCKVDAFNVPQTNRGASNFVTNAVILPASLAAGQYTIEVTFSSGNASFSSLVGLNVK